MPGDGDGMPGDGDGMPGDGDGVPGDGDGSPGDGDGSPGVCGDATIDPGEDCEGSDLAGMSCTDLGYTGGELACGLDCLFDTSGCTSAVCGDGVATDAEACDMADLLGQDCTLLGYDGGELLCNVDCTLDESGCYSMTCGNDTIEGMEACDGVDLGGLTCADQGFISGELACDMNCQFDTSGCSTCGNDAIDNNEVCDGTDVGGETCVNLGYLGGTLACSNTCDALDESGCQDSWWSDDFESGMALEPEWVLGGNANWFGSAVSVHAGMYAGETGNIADNQTSHMEVTLNFVQAGTVQFWYRVSTETGWDYLRFFVDGVQQTQWSGNIAWSQSIVYNVPAGMHTLRWLYYKDGSVSSNLDTVWVDDIVTVGALLP
jgi:hypothetical protein